MLKLFSNWWSQKLVWPRVKSHKSQLFHHLLTWSQTHTYRAHAIIQFVSYNVYPLLHPLSLSCHVLVLMPYQSLLLFFQLIWSLFPPAITYCLSYSGIRLIILVCSHSSYHYAQRSGHLSIKENCFERSCQHPHIHTLKHTHRFMHKLTVMVLLSFMWRLTWMTPELLNSHVHKTQHYSKYLNVLLNRETKNI